MASVAPPSLSPSSIRSARPKPPRVLVVDDEAQARRALAGQLMERGMDVLTAADGDAALALIEASHVDVMIVDFEMPGTRGAELLHRVQAGRDALEVIVLANPSNAHEAAPMIGEGAFLFLTRPVSSPDILGAAVLRAVEKRRLAERARQSERSGAVEPVEVIATSKVMRTALDDALGAAQIRVPVLLAGESGTGKELVARAMHQRSPRARRPFVVVRCPLVPASATDSDWMAGGEGGTLFLDEVDRLAEPLQARLVDVIEAQVPDLRVIAATEVDLKRSVDAAGFRRDLYFRLNAVVIRLPALRRRRDDIPVLAYFLLAKTSQRLGRSVRRISPEALRMLRGYDWPGNVRELQSVIERAVARAKGEAVLPADLDDEGGEVPGQETDGAAAEMTASLRLPTGIELASFNDAKKRVVDEFETAYCAAALRRAGGNIAEAAQLAGLDRSNFKRILKRQGIPAGRARGRRDRKD